jgi:transposase
MKNSKEKTFLRFHLVKHAQKKGIRDAARYFECSRNTVRKWVRRFDGTIESLKSKSRAPHSHPQKISEKKEKRIVKSRKKLPFGAKRLKKTFNLSASDHAINRVLRKHNMLRKYRKKKHNTKNNLREVKKAYRLFEHFQVDTKHLYDIPHYWPQMKDLGLPEYQYTAREVTTGAQFVSYADDLSLTYATLFVKRLIEHLNKYGADLSETTFQSDNGSEFIGSVQAKNPSAFSDAVENGGCKAHVTIPPKAYTWQADVETVHNLVELEFFDIEKFRSRKEFLTKVAWYQHFFNIARPNSYKEDKTPLQLAEEKDDPFDVRMFLLPPAFLENELDNKLHSDTINDEYSKVGHHVPSLPLFLYFFTFSATYQVFQWIS